MRRTVGMWVSGVSMALLCLLAGSPGTPAAVGVAQPKIRILATTFPVFLFTQNVVQGASGVLVESMLPPSMGCPHDYVLTPSDMEKISRATILVVNGLGLEEFLGAPVLRANPKVVLVDSSLGIKEILEHRGHQPEGAAPQHPRRDTKGTGSGRQKPSTGTEARGHTHQEDAPHQHAGPNPHLFASPRMAAKMVRNIASALGKADPANADLYKKNGAAYSAELDALADEFRAAGETLKNRTIVTQHAVLDYLARDAGLQVAAVVQDDPGMEPSAAEMMALVRLIRRQKVGALFTEPQYPAKVGETIAREAKIPAAVLDPVATGKDGAPLDTYQQVMRQNLEILKSVLGTTGD